jgi:hypothetical protein
VLDALLDSGFTEGRAPADPRLADLLRLAIAVDAIEVTAENALDMIRLHELSVELQRQGADTSVAAVTGPVVVGPADVAIGPRSVPLVRAGCAPAARAAADPGVDGESIELPAVG